ncbi:MAG: nucleotidyl transferase AbiEii/AbiGii toxin family protein [Firmicutes bacterium]|nr:nucleotidyl transferase AbiEii/AbiGii toxin family protein [Bacillota bacterium]
MNSNKLNNIIKKKSKGNNNLAHHLHQMFFFEHVLMRLEKSIYRDNIILKGGVLLSSIIGENLRTTKDIDATLKSLPLNMDTIKNIFEEIFDLNIDDNVNFEIVSIKDIRLEDEYGGFKINVKGTFDKIRTNFFIEITTGDIITPREIKYKYNSIFEDKKINIMAYTIETIIAEKFESIINKNITTTRAKDFYDLYMLMKNKNDINNKNLVKAIENTFKKRNTKFDIDSFKEIIELLSDSHTLRRIFADYQEKLEYTKLVKFNDTIKSIKNIVDILEQELIEI